MESRRVFSWLNWAPDSLADGGFSVSRFFFYVDLYLWSMYLLFLIFMLTIFLVGTCGDY